jgi:hypothetical protein
MGHLRERVSAVSYTLPARAVHLPRSIGYCLKFIVIALVLAGLYFGRDILVPLARTAHGRNGSTPPARPSLVRFSVALWSRHEELDQKVLDRGRVFTGSARFSSRSRSGRCSRPASSSP